MRGRELFCCYAADDVAGSFMVENSTAVDAVLLIATAGGFAIVAAAVIDFNADATASISSVVIATAAACFVVHATAASPSSPCCSQPRPWKHESSVDSTRAWCSRFDCPESMKSIRKAFILLGSRQLQQAYIFALICTCRPTY